MSQAGSGQILSGLESNQIVKISDEDKEPKTRNAAHNTKIDNANNLVGESQASRPIQTMDLQILPITSQELISFLNSQAATLDSLIRKNEDILKNQQWKIPTPKKADEENLEQTISEKAIKKVKKT